MAGACSSGTSKHAPNPIRPSSGLESVFLTRSFFPGFRAARSSPLHPPVRESPPWSCKHVTGRPGLHKPTDNDFDQLFVALTDSVITWSDFGVWKDLGRVIVVNHDKARSRGILRGPLARPPPLRNGASQPMVRLSLRQYWPNAMSLQRGKR